MKVRTNADTPADAAQARKFGAEGIGLCRTEHMFFDATRIMAMREMIVAQDEEGRRAALAKILPMQRQDFIELFEIMAGLPVTIRLLDPPLHEFLPHGDAEINELAETLNMEASALRARLTDLQEQNPMLGHRGCRLAITYPEIAEMQARAIFEAAIEAGRQTGTPVVPEVMVPADRDQGGVRHFESGHRQGGEGSESGLGRIDLLPRRHHDRAAARSAESRRHRQDRRVLLLRHERSHANNLSALSRDDSGSFLGDYLAQGIFETDPFVSLDPEGVGELVKIAAERGRKTRPGLEARHLRRAWRRSGLHRVLRDRWARLCVLLALPRAGCAAGGSASRGAGEGRRERLVLGITGGCPPSSCSHSKQARYGALVQRCMGLPD